MPQINPAEIAARYTTDCANKLKPQGKAIEAAKVAAKKIGEEATVIANDSYKVAHMPIEKEIPADEYAKAIRANLGF